MRKKSRYYTGPEGVFYNPETDALCVLERAPGYIIDIKTWEKKAPMFNVYYYGGKALDTAVEVLPNHVVRIGDL